MATQFGVAGALRIAKGMHFLNLVCFIMVGVLMHLALIYYGGVFIALVTLCYQHSIVSVDNLSQVTQVYFMRNGIVAISIFLFTLVSII